MRTPMDQSDFLASCEHLWAGWICTAYTGIAATHLSCDAWFACDLVVKLSRWWWLGHQHTGNTYIYRHMQMLFIPRLPHWGLGMRLVSHRVQEFVTKPATARWNLPVEICLRKTAPWHFFHFPFQFLPGPLHCSPLPNIPTGSDIPSSSSPDPRLTHCSSPLCCVLRCQFWSHLFRSVSMASIKKWMVHSDCVFCQPFTAWQYPGHIHSA